MNHLDFIVWMCAFPIACTVDEAIRNQYCERREYSDASRAITALVMLCLYAFVAMALW
jgi:hypothetical protein